MIKTRRPAALFGRKVVTTCPIADDILPAIPTGATVVIDDWLNYAGVWLVKYKDELYIVKPNEIQP